MSHDSFLNERPVMLNTYERIALMAALIPGTQPNRKWLRRAQIKLATHDPEKEREMFEKEALS